MTALTTLALNDDDLDAAVRTVYGEARNQPFEGQVAVAFVIRNRATWDPPSWWGHRVAAVCRHPFQFSCHNVGDPNGAVIAALSDTSLLYTALMNGVVKPVMAGVILDPTDGATHYKVRGTQAEWDKAIAGIAPICIGVHDFYRLGPHA